VRSQVSARGVDLRGNRGSGLHGRRSDLLLRDAIVADNEGAGIALVEPRGTSIADTFLWSNARDLDPETTVLGPGVRFAPPPPAARPRSSAYSGMPAAADAASP
jgi:hypothetical protein